MKKVTFILGILFCFILQHCIYPNFLYSQVGGGGYVASYLLKENGTRPISLAGAFTAVSNDPNSIYYNPAGLSSCAPVPMVFLNYSTLQYSRSYANLTYAQSFDNFGIGASVSSYKTGSIVGRNISGIEIGRFTDYFINFVLGGSYSTSFASFGIAAKYLNNSLQGSGISANGFSFDFGSKFNILDLFNFGLSVQNIGGYLKYNTRENKSLIPFVIRAGLATEFSLSEPKTITYRNEIGLIDTIIQPSPHYLLISLDAQYVQHQKHPNFILAIEFCPYEIITFRGGFTFLGEKDERLKALPMNIWGAGISIKPNLEDFYNLFSIDFSIGNDYLSQQKIFYSIGIGFQF